MVKVLDIIENDLEATETEVKAADMNKDGVITFVDAVRLFYMVNGLI